MLVKGKNFMNHGGNKYRLSFSSSTTDNKEIISGVAIFEVALQTQIAVWTPYAGLCEPYGGGQLLDTEDLFDFDLHPMSVRCALFWAEAIKTIHKDLPTEEDILSAGGS